MSSCCFVTIKIYCKYIIFHIIRLFAKVAVGDITSTDINVQPKRLSVDLLKVEEEEQPSLHRSSSCQELQDYQVVRVSMTGSDSCNYKSIMVSCSPLIISLITLIT